MSVVMSVANASTVARALVVIVAWCVTIALGVVALARFVAYDRRRLITMFDAYTAWVYLPAYPIALVAFATGRVALGFAAAAVAVVHLSLIGVTATRAVSVPGDDVALRVVTANLRFRNGKADRLARELAGYEADIVFLQEVTPQWFDVLCAPDAFGSYPGKASAVVDHPGGAAIFSRLPLRDAVVGNAAGWPLLTAVVEHPIVGPIRCIDVHPAPPPYGFARHEAMVAAIVDRARDSVERGERTIVAGDFNLTQFNRTLQVLRRLGLRSAHEMRRQVLAVTWPNGRRRLPPIRVDHVLCGKPLVAVSVTHGRGIGSDHRPVIVDLACGRGKGTASDGGVASAEHQSGS
jgi:endonuclease/exonuclease/phosphatase (EEP) superfamily protein YafD